MSAGTLTRASDRCQSIRGWRNNPDPFLLVKPRLHHPEDKRQSTATDTVRLHEQPDVCDYEEIYDRRSMWSR